MRWSLIFLSVIGLALASPIDPPIKASLSGDVGARNALLEAQFRALLESLRDMEELNPLEIDYIHLDDAIVPLPGFTLTIVDAFVNQLNTFVINQLSISITSLFPTTTYRAIFDLGLPELDVGADHYNVHAPIDGGLAIFGNGDAKIDLIEPRVNVNVLARVSIFGGLSLEQCTVRVYLKGFKSQITGLLGDDPAVDAFVNTFLSHFVPDLISEFQNEITALISPIVMDIANEILGDINIGDLLP